MDKSEIVLDEDDRLALIKASMRDDPTVVLQLLAKYPCENLRLDAHGNTIFHFAVAALALLVIKCLVEKTVLNPNIKNFLGESPITWFQRAVRNTLSMTKPLSLRELARAIAEDDKKGIDFFMSHGIFLDLHCVDPNGIIRGPLSIAIYYGRWEFANWLLDQPLAVSTLNIEDGEGKTSITLAKEQTGKQAAAILERMQRMQASVSGEKPLKQPSSLMLSVSREAWPPKGYKDIISSLKKKFLRGVTQKDFPEVHSALPLLYGLIDRSFRGALLPPRTHEERSNKQKILQRLSNGAYELLEKQIAMVREYWENIRQRNLENKLIEISDEPKIQAFTETNLLLDTGGTIYINPTLIDSVAELWMTLIHEISHAAAITYDHAYTGSQGSCTWDFSSLMCLAAGRKLSRETPEKIQILDTLWSLENKLDSASPRKTLTRGQFYATQNADTLTMAIFYCLMANTENLGRIDFRKNILYFDVTFPELHHLKELQRLFPDDTSSESTLEVPNSSGNRGSCPGCFRGEDKKLRSASESPKARTSSMNLATVSGSDKSPSGSSIGSVSTAASPPALPQRMASFEDDDEAMAGPSLVHCDRPASSSSCYKKGESISPTFTSSE